MRCSRIQEKLAEYAFGDLPEWSARMVELHVSDCAGCRQGLQETKALLSMVSRYEDVDPPEEAYIALKREAEKRSRNRRSGIYLLWRPAPAYAAAAAIALFAVISGVDNRMEMGRLERINALLSDSLRILNARPVGTSSSIRQGQDSAGTSDSSTSSFSIPGAEIPFGD